MLETTILFSFYGHTCEAHGTSWARGQIRVAAEAYSTATATLDLSRILRPVPQLAAMLDPSPTEGGQGLNPPPQGHYVRFLTSETQRELLEATIR